MLKNLSSINFAQDLISFICYNDTVNYHSRITVVASSNYLQGWGEPDALLVQGLDRSHSINKWSSEDSEEFISHVYISR